MEHGSGTVDFLIAIRTVAETGSTNADMLDAARMGAAEGEWLRAGRQLAGRGRQGRSWQSPAGNLYASTIVRLRATDPSAPSLALVAGLAVADAISPFVSGVELKWPNDLLLGGAKLAGILLERAGDAVVIGFGINVLHHPDLPERRTTSLVEHGIAIDAAMLLDMVAARMADRLARWRGDGLAAVLTRWQALAHPPGTPLRAELPDRTVVTGTFAGLDAAGALLILVADGSTRTIHAGDVFGL